MQVPAAERIVFCIENNMEQNEGRLKILFVPAWYPSGGHPVAGIFVREQAKAVSRNNDVVVVYACPDLRPSGRKLYQVSETTEDGIRTFTTRYKESPIPKTSTIAFHLVCWWSILAALRKLKREGWKPDIIHAHVYTAGVPAVVVGKAHRIPVVIAEHNSVFVERELNLFERLEARFVMNGAQMVLPVSRYLKEGIEACGIGKNFRIIPNVVNTEIFHPSPSRHESIRDGRKKILLVALFNPVKGIPTLLEALSQIKEGRQDFVLDVIGDGLHRTEYEELTRRLGLEGLIVFHGLKTKEETADFMRGCAFLVMPSYFETFGVVCIEAMACGKPVVASRIPALVELVGEEAGVLVLPRNVRALAEGIEYMLDHYRDYSWERIASHAKERFRYEVVGQMLDEVYRIVTLRHRGLS